MEYHQAGNLSQAEAIYRQILGVAPDHPGALHFLGLLAKQSGQPEIAAKLIRRSLASKPDYAEAHGNLGNVLGQLGRPDEALASYHKALSLKPDFAEVHANLGNLLRQQGKLDEAAASYRRALALKPDLAQLHNNLGNVLYEQGKLDDALASYRLALRYKPDFAEAHNNLGNVLNEQGKCEDAIAHYHKALVRHPGFAEACNNLGNALSELGRLDEAASRYRDAIARKPDYAGAYKNLGDILRKQGDLDGALASYQRALQITEDPEITEGFVRCLKNLYFTRPMAGLSPLLARAISVPWARPAELTNPAISLLKLHPGISQLVERASRAWPGRLSQQELFGYVESSAPSHPCHPGDSTGAIPSSAMPSSLPPGLALVCNDILLRCLLESTAVCDVGLERFLTMTRHILLETALGMGSGPEIPDRCRAASSIEAAEESAAPSAGTGIETDERILVFCCALARQCFINEYIFECTNEESGKIKALQARIGAALDDKLPVPALWVSAFAAYRPLTALRQAQTLLDTFADEEPPHALSTISGARGASAAATRQAVAALLEQQIREPLEEQKYRALIPRLTPVTEGSRQVQRQYEENPYPRWMKLPSGGKRVSLEDDLRRRFPSAPLRPIGTQDGMAGGVDILVAGCGTGQHSIATAQRYRNARILAIDLSLTSLCYAKRKTDGLGLENIEYAQADIMGLDSAALPGRTFSLIESVGVLHHLADPLAGWRKLVDLLPPGGVMRVGLYSDIARTNEMAARNFAEDLIASPEGAGEDPAADIRRCRQAIMATENTSRFRQVLAARDFYTMSECRDLLFHVQEHRYTLPQLREHLSELALSLIGFSLEPDILAGYAQLFPADGSQTDLDNWHRFEIENPGTFIGMYQFWVQKA